MAAPAGPRVRIEPLTRDHAEPLAGLADPRVYAHVEPADAVLDATALRAQIAALLDAEAGTPAPALFRNFAVRDAASDACIGRLELYAHGDGEAELAFLFVPDSWGKGLATEAVRLLIRAAGQVGGVRRVWVCVTPDNRRALALCARIGFAPAPPGDWPDLASHAAGDVVLALPI